jgi:heme/copper-type cytochrome/quinol oxidase subunit 4
MGNTMTKRNSNQITPKNEVSEPNKIYRKMMVCILFILSIITVVLSFCARYQDEEQKPELLVSFLIVSCLYSSLQFLLFVSMVKCAEKYEPAIGFLFSAMVFTILSIILASISKYRIDNEEDEEITTNWAIVFSFFSLLLSLICAYLVIKN